MGRIERQKRQAIQEANKRILLEKIIITSDEGDIYTIGQMNGNLAVETPDFNGIYKMTVVEDDGQGGYSDVTDLTLNSVNEMPNGELVVNVTGYLWFMSKTKENIIPKEKVKEIINNVKDRALYFIIKGEENSVKFTKVSSII